MLSSLRTTGPRRLKIGRERNGVFSLLFYVAKYNLGKVRLELMLSAASPFTVCDLPGGPLEICRAFVSRCISHAVLIVDRCGSIIIALC